MMLTYGEPVVHRSRGILSALISVSLDLSAFHSVFWMIASDGEVRGVH